MQCCFLFSVCVSFFLSCFMSVTAVEGNAGVQLAMPVATLLGSLSSNLARCSTYALGGVVVTF